jgi:hypothetical protein
MVRKNTKQVSKVYIKPTTLAAVRGRTYLGEYRG